MNDVLKRIEIMEQLIRDLEMSMLRFEIDLKLIQTMRYDLYETN